MGRAQGHTTLHTGRRELEPSIPDSAPALSTAHTPPRLHLTAQGGPHTIKTPFLPPDANLCACAATKSQPASGPWEPMSLPRWEEGGFPVGMCALCTVLPS